MPARKEHFQGSQWVMTGILWGLFVWLGTEIVFPLLTDAELVWRRILLSIPLWVIIGLVFGGLMRIWAGPAQENDPPDRKIR